MAQVRVDARRAHLERVCNAPSDAIHRGLQESLGLARHLGGDRFWL
jgi:hypothetical protein